MLLMSRDSAKHAAHAQNMCRASTDSRKSYSIIRHTAEAASIRAQRLLIAPQAPASIGARARQEASRGAKDLRLRTPWLIHPAILLLTPSQGMQQDLMGRRTHSHAV